MAAKKPRFAILGAGMSGILAAVKLQQAGYDFTVFEKDARIGGTWRDNTYPGIACDVPSHIYSYSFELNPDWSHFCSPGAEIQNYFEDIVRRHNLAPKLRLGDAVVRCEWRGDEWEVESAAGHTERAAVVIAATGILHHPKTPDIPGLETFAGAQFHSARWDHNVQLDGRRVGVIGTGSSGVQITGALAARAAKFCLFQRTAQWVVPVEQKEYTAAERAAFRADPKRLQQTHEELSRAFNDGFATSVLDGNSDFIRGIETQCREHLESAIANPQLREQLRPNYRAACKRLVVSHNFYEAIQHPNARLITAPIARVCAEGVRTEGGELHELDVLVLATGFHVDRFMRPMEIRGREGLLLDKVWAKRPSAYLALSVPGFPNFFMLNGPNSPVGNFSLIQTAELQFAYIMQLVEQVQSGALAAAEATPEAARRFEEERVAAAKKTVWATGCRSWYLDDRGIPFAWPFPFARFRKEMAAPRLADYRGAA